MKKSKLDDATLRILEQLEVKDPKSGLQKSTENEISKRLKEAPKKTQVKNWRDLVKDDLVDGSASMPSKEL